MPAEKKNKELFEEVGKKILTLHEKEEIVLEEEINAGWSEVKQKISRGNKKSRYMIFSAAAMLAGVLLVSYFTLNIFHSSQGDKLLVDIWEDSLNYENVKEVTLLTETQNVVLENDAEVKYGSDGDITVNEKEVSAAKTNDAEKKAKLNQIIVPHGKRTRLTFVDGTQLFVNSCSRVLYPAVFDENKREIFVEGEVYLDVAKDTSRPFFVRTEGFDVKVLGTSFNIKSYKEDKEASVVLVEGAVEMTAKHTNETVRLKPGEKLTIASDGLSIMDVNVNEYIYWKENILYLGNYKYCGDILNNLSRYYGIKIKYNENIGNIPIGGKLDVCESIEDVLEILKISIGVTYYKEDNNIIVTK